MPQIIQVPNYGDVEFPDDMSDEDIVVAIKKNALGYKEKQPALSRTDKFLQGVKDPIDAGAQLLANIAPKGLETAVNKANNYIADKTGLLGKLPEGGINQQINQNEQAYQDKRTAAGETGLDGYRLGGNILSPANLAIASKIPAGATLGKNLLIGAAAGAGTSAATQPVFGNGNFGEEKLKQAAIGAGAGVLGQGLTSGISRLISPNASTNANVQLLRNQGVTPTIGQTLGGMPNKIEQKLTSVPLLGDMIRSSREGANNSFETAAYNRTLKPIGLELPKGLQGRDALSFTENALKTKYDDVLTKIGAVVPDSQYNAKVTNLTQIVDKLNIPADKKMEYQTVLDIIKESSDANGVMTSQGYKDLEGELGRISANLSGSKNLFDNRIAPAVKQVRQELQDMLERQAGPLAKDLKATNQSWAQFKKVQKASSMLGASEGSFSPSQLQNAVKAGDKSKDKAAFARGNAMMQDLSEAGKSVLGDSVPDSGTTGRMLMGGGALASYIIDPTIPLGIAGSSLLYTNPMQRLLTGAVASRPELAAPTAELLRKSGKYMIPAFSSVGLGLMNQ